MRDDDAKEVLLLTVALGALGGWAWFLVASTRAQLPQAQAYQALFKLNEMKDQSIREILGKFDAREKSPDLQKQIDAITRKAQQQGFVINPTQGVPHPTPPNSPTVGPPPEPVIDFDVGMPFVE
jgi:hypothetical protein